MSVLLFPVFMNMLVYQIDAYKKFFIVKYFRGSTGFLYGMFFGKHCNPRLQVFDQIKLMRGENYGFSGMVKFQKELHKKRLSFWIET